MYKHFSGVEDVCVRKMVDKACVRGCYDELAVGDAECNLAKDNNKTHTIQL